jgi:hypothetical protein
MKHKIIWGVLIVILLIVACSGWIFNFTKERADAKNKELVTLQSSFTKQYGTDGITINQIVSPGKVYAASWTSKDGIMHVSWSIGGIWVTVYNSSTPTTITPVPLVPMP